MRICLLLSVLLVSINSFSQDIKIIPQPVELFVSNAPEKFTVTSKTLIVLRPGVDTTCATFFKTYVKKFYNLNLKLVNNSSTSATNNTIVVELSPSTISTDPKDKYTLLVNKNSISLSSASQAGLFYGFQTLIQLLPVPYSIHNITDNKTFNSAINNY
jgi:hexosaminidase